MHPFRAHEHAQALAPSEVVRDAVAQMVQQFADPLAFYRELVQNSIDAGATAVHARLAWEPGDDDARGTLRVSVSDDGEGMDLRTLEQCLLVLFRSSKDGDRSKIGKFGVGFFSVLAVGPAVVLVDTGTGADGYHVTLEPSHTYAIEAAPPRRGTTVTLRVPMAASDAADFARRSLDALATWCPHVAVALHADTTAVPGAEQSLRVDSPLAVEAEVAVVHAEAGATYALGVADEATAAFYNRGILLHATTALVPGVAFKVSAPDLSHTLSRDDVRRDATFDRCLARVRELARGPLRARLVAALNDTAAASARARHRGADEPDLRRRLHVLARAAGHDTFALRPAEIAWPLVHPTPLDEGATVPVASFDRGIFSREPRLYAPGPDPLTEALATHGVPVVDLGAAAGGLHGDLFALLRRLFPETAVAAAERYCAPRVVPDDALAAPERVLLDALRPALAAVSLPTAALADPVGAGADRLFLALAPDALAAASPHHLLDAQDTDEPPFALFGARGVALHRRHPRVVAAVRAAARDPALAAFALARLVLLAAGALDAGRDRALLAHVARATG